MAIQSEISQISYLGNGSAGTGYPVPFYFFEDTDLRVSRTDAAGAVTQLSLGAHYSVSGAGNASGGAVTTTTAYGGSDRITIARIVPATQPLVYDENDRFPAKSHERGLDRLTMLAQQVARAAKRGFRLGDSQGEIPAIEARTPNSLAGLDGDGAPKLYTIDQLVTLLSLPAPILNRPTKTFSDDGGRAEATPDFVGQIGTQQDTKAVYVANGLTAGSWMIHALSPLQLLSPMILDQEYSESIGGDGNFIFCPDSLSPLYRGTFGKLKDWMLSQQRAGAVLQSVFGTLSAHYSASSAIPNDDSLPQSDEGNPILAASITPTNAANKLRVTFIGNPYSSGIPGVVSLFKSGSTDAIATACVFDPDNKVHAPLVMQTEVVAGSTDPVAFNVRAGPLGSAGTIYFNGTNTGRRFGGAMKTTLLIEEIKA